MTRSNRSKRNPRSRLVTSARKLDDTSQLALVYRLASPARTRAQRFELAVGSISSGTDNRPFISLALQAQHTSNGGINGTNPGLDMVGVTFAVEFRD